jgi:glycosyltransferase involved in cell wall biosynthesis
MTRHLVLISGADQTCGVEAFARLSAAHLGERGATQPLGGRLAPSDDVVINLPVVAWKKRLLAPIVAAVRARFAGRRVTIVLHEWADLTLARRVSYLPLLPLATRLLFSAPEVQAQFESTPVSAVTTKLRGIVPIPPNLTAPQWTTSTPLSDSLAADRRAGRLILGQFGSIYPKKDPLVLLETAAELKRRGVELRVVFIGSFIKAADTIEADFHARVAELGLQEEVLVSGYVATSAELHALFAEVDCFLYPLSEGLTSRRGSVLAAALSGKPVLVTGPERSDSLSHHRLFRSLLANGSLRLLPRGADASALADAVLATRGAPPAKIAFTAEIDAVWKDITAVLDA